MKFKLFLIATLAIFLIDLYGGWDDAFKAEKQPNQKTDSKKNAAHSAGMEIDVTERISASSKGEWFEALAPDADQKNAKDEPPELKKLIQGVNQIDAIMPDDMPAKSIMISQLAQGFFHYGDFARGEQLALRSLRLSEKLKGTNSPDVMYCLRNLAVMYSFIGEYERAISQIESCFEIIEKNKEINRGFIPALYSSLSQYQLSAGKIEQANKSAEQAVQESKKRDDMAGLDVAYLSFADVQKKLGNYEKSKELYKQASDILDKKYQKIKEVKSELKNLGDGTALAYALLSLFELYTINAEIDQANALMPRLEELFKELYIGKLSGDNLRFTRARAVFYRMIGQDTKAIPLAEDYLKYQHANLPSALEMVESQRLGWQNSNLSFSVPVAFGTVQQLADCVLNWKGIVLDSLIADQKILKSSVSNDEKTMLDRVTALKRQLSQLQINKTDALDKEYVKFLQNKIFSLEKQMAKASRQIAPKTTPVNLDLVRDQMKQHEVLIDFITYRELPDVDLGRKMLGALLILKNENPVWIPLGPEEILAKDAQKLQHLILSSISDKELDENLRRNWMHIMQPIITKIPDGTQQLYISPDGFLNFLPFACLLDGEGRFLVERYNLSYLSSGRDLLKTSFNPLYKKTMHIFSNPLFETQTCASNKVLNSGQRDIAGGDFGSLSLNPLPGTEVEANKLKNLAEISNWSVLLSAGVDAREEKLGTLNSPGILHLATHGFYFGKKCVANAQSGDRGMSIMPSQYNTLQENAMASINPMLLSGIALSGAQNTFKQWGEGKAPDPATDGIVTAEEVGCLNLTDTWLVSLSACETGIGEAKSGEGVFGLRRSFMMAGTKNLLMTLWPVDDEATAGFMADFYSMALNSNEAAKSLAHTQRNWLIKKRQEKGLLAAVRNAGPFVMATTGN